MLNFLKKEKLNNKKLINKLFKNGKIINLCPINIIYIPYNKSYNKILFNISKKIFKNAIIRNKIKRKILESYRLNKNTFYKKNKIFFLIAYIYINYNIYNYWIIKEKIIESINYLINLKKMLIYENI